MNPSLMAGPIESPPLPALVLLAALLSLVLDAPASPPAPASSRSSRSLLHALAPTHATESEAKASKRKWEGFFMTL
jgi:hypothetical protein